MSRYVWRPWPTAGNGKQEHKHNPRYGSEVKGKAEKPMKMVQTPGIDGGPLKIMLAGKAQERLAPLVAGLMNATDAELYQAKSESDVMNLLTTRAIELVVLDEELADVAGLQMARRLAEKMPFVNCVLISSLAADEFHEQTEGLGVLMQLPSPPAAGDAETMLFHFNVIRAMQPA